MTEILIDSLKDCVLDVVRIVPFLFLTYAAMEYLEHIAGDRTIAAVRRADRLGPAIGSLLGVIPQCGFSAAAASLYAGRVITAGTMMAVFLSTSDEMLPIMLSRSVPVPTILRILICKVVLAMFFGFLTDFLFRRFNRRRIGEGIHDLCRSDQCECEKGVLHSAIRHTLQIAAFLLLISFLLNIVIALVGEESLKGIVLNQPVIGELLSGLLGLIPNCAASIVITTLYMEGAMSAGAMISGLLVGAGVGLVILFRNNRKKKESVQLAALLYATGVIGGIAVDLAGIHF